jgi:hypothetical protein
MNNSDFNLSKNQYVTEHFKKKELTDIKELIVGREKKMKNYIKDIQDGVINFCIQFNNLQNETNFFNLRLSNQYKFNECVDKSIVKLQNDFLNIEQFYLKCKQNCFQSFPQSVSNLENFLENSNRFLKPKLNPCLLDCRVFFDGIHNKYQKYLLQDNGIFIEFMDYPNWEDRI